MLLFGTNFISTLAAAVATAASWDVSGDGSNCIPYAWYLGSMQSAALNMATSTSADARKLRSTPIGATGPGGWIALTAMSSQSVTTLAEAVNGIAASEKARNVAAFIFPPCLTKNHNHL